MSIMVYGKGKGYAKAPKKRKRNAGFFSTSLGGFDKFLMRCIYIYVYKTYFPSKATVLTASFSHKS